jgi:ubiquinone/menaquinone biosynthesis C-methylase UbiE
MDMTGALWIALIGCAGLLFVWLVMARLISKLGVRGPCPASFSWIVNNPIRRWYMRSVLDRVGIRPGERVLELGPGPGAFTIEAARRTEPGGRLLAVDIQAKMIAVVERKVRESKLSNVETYLADASHLPVNNGSIDRAFLVTVLPEIPDRKQALNELRRVLKPGGVLSLTEEFLDPDYPLVRTTIRWAEEAGFELEGRHGNWWIYTLNFRKPKREDKK